MFNKIIDFSLRFKMIILFLYAIICAYSLRSLTNINIDVFPDLNKPSATLMIESQGLAPNEMEKLVIIPLENAINGATGITRLTSSAGIGYGIVKAEFDWNTDVFLARQIINERMTQVELPNNVKISMTPISSIMGEVMLVGLISNNSNVSQMELKNIAEFNIRKRFLSIPGVANVSIMGGDSKQYHIILNHLEMQLLNINLDDVIFAIENAGSNGTGGFLQYPYTEDLINIVGRPKNIEDLKNIVISKETRKDAPSITLNQIAKIEISSELNKRGDAGINGLDGILISISKQPNADTIKLTKSLEKEIDNISNSLPKDVELTKGLFKQSNFISNSIDNITSSLGTGALLIIIILYIFLANFRTTFIVVLIIPLTLLITSLIFNFFGLNINTMTLGGIAMALGSLIDDAIVTVENIYKCLKINKCSEKPDNICNVICKASEEIRNSVIFSTILLFLIFIPMFSMGGIQGKIFTPLALSFIISMGVSTIVSLTLTPVLSAYLLPNVKFIGRKNETWLVKKIKILHSACLTFCFKYFKFIIVSTIILCLFSLTLFMSFGKEFLPPFNEGSFIIGVATPLGTNLEESKRIGKIVENKLLEIPEIATTARKQGRAELDEHGLGVNVSEIEVALKPDIKINKEKIESSIREKLNLPGVIISIGQPISHRIDFIISGIQAGIVVKVFGMDENHINDIALQIEDIMKQNKGLTDIQRDMQIKTNQLEIQLNSEKALRYGVQLGSALKMIETASSGKPVSKIIDNEMMYDVILKFKTDFKNNIETIKNIPIPSVQGYNVPLKMIADIYLTKSQNDISRENGMRRSIIQANLVGRDSVKIVNELQNSINKNVNLKTGTFLKIDGQFKTQQEASTNILILSIVSILLMYGALYINLNNLNLATQLMLSIPLALIGGVFGIWLTSKVVSIATIIGFIALIGIAIRNGLLLIEIYKKAQENQKEKLKPTQLIELTQKRIEPIMMTTLTSIIGFIPLLLAGNTVGKEILYPVATVITFGLISTTILTLLITPILFNSLNNR